MIDASIERVDGAFVLSLQDYTTSNAEPESFVLSRDDLLILRSVIDVALDHATL